MHQFLLELAKILDCSSTDIDRAIEISQKRKSYFGWTDKPFEIDNTGEIIYFSFRSFLYEIGVRSSDKRYEIASDIVLPFYLLPKLQKLDISYLKIKAIDLSKNNLLAELKCGNNLFETIDLSESSSLEKLSVRNFERNNDVSVPLKNILLPKNPSKLKSITLHNNLITKLDLSNCVSLVEIHLANNGMRELILPKSGKDLKTLVVADNIDNSLIIKNYTNLEFLSVENLLVNFKHNINLESVSANSLTDEIADLSRLTKLKSLYINNSPLLSVLDISHNKNLEVLYIHDDTKINYLDLTNNIKLSQLKVDIKKINLKSLPEQALFVPELRKNYPNLKKYTKTLNLYDKAIKYNWDDGLVELNKIINNSNCDKATALYIYWLADPVETYRRNKDVTKVNSEYDRQLINLLKKIEKKIHDNFYNISIIPFDPGRHRGVDLMTEDAYNSSDIPLYMKTLVKGEKVI